MGLADSAGVLESLSPIVGVIPVAGPALQAMLQTAKTICEIVEVSSSHVLTERANAE